MTGRRYGLRPGTQIPATQDCNKNPDTPVGYTSLLNGARRKQMITIDETLQEEESDTTRKEGHEKSRPTDGMKIGREKGQDG